MNTNVLVGGKKREDVLAERRRQLLDKQQGQESESSGSSGPLLHDDLITLSSGIVVSLGSVDPRNPEGLVEYASEYQHRPDFPGAYPQTGDLAVIVRDELDKNPLVGPDGKPNYDGSDLYQRLSDLAWFRFDKKGHLVMKVSDLPTMYPGNLTKQLEVATRIGYGFQVNLDDPLAVDIQNSAGLREAVIPSGNHYPYVVAIKKYGNDKVAKAVFANHAHLNAEYLARKGYTDGVFYLAAESSSLLDGTKALIRPFALSGVDKDLICNVHAGGLDNRGGRVRAGSIFTKKLP